MMIRKPIPDTLKLILGVASILLLIVLYTLFSNSRAAGKRQEAATSLTNVLQSITEVEQRVTGAAESQRDELDRQLKVLRAQADNLKGEAENAVDRTVPTWSSLYRDGLLKVIQPQGLMKDERWLREDAAATTYRLAGGLLLGVLLSVMIGILMGSFTWMEAFFVPPLAFLSKVPPTAMLAAFFVLVGTNYKMYVTMIAFGTLPTLAQTIYQSAKKDVPETMVYKAYTLGAGNAELIWNVIYKQILPRVIDAIRLQIGPALVLLIAAEWMVAGEGFGYRLRLFYQRTDMTVVYLYSFLLGAGGLIVDYVLIRFRRWLCPWFGD